MPEVAVPLPPTDTVTVRSAGKVSPSVEAVTVTVVSPEPSATLVSSTASVMSVWSLSVSFSVASIAGTASGTLTLIVSSPSITVSSVGVRVKVSVRLDAPAFRTALKSFTAVKSVPAAAVPLLTLNGISIAFDIDTPPVFNATVTVVTPAPSETLVGDTVKVDEVLSLSSTCPLAGVTVVPVAVPLTVSVSGGSSRESSRAVVVKVAVPLVCPALMVMLKLLTVV